MSAARRYLEAVRSPERAARLALVLWMAWAFLIWNVVFDHAVEVAGRQYVHAAAAAAAAGGPFAQIDDWMRPAVTRGLWAATLAAAAIVIGGLLGLGVARSRQAHRAAG